LLRIRFNILTRLKPEKLEPIGGPTCSLGLGGHAVMAVGYDDSAERVFVRNSWGADWGIKGYFTTPYDYISNDNLADDLWTVRGLENV